MLRKLKSTSSHQREKFRGGAVGEGVEEAKAEKQKYVPPPHRTFVLVRREGDVWIPLRQFTAQSPRNVALKVKVPSGSLVSIQDPVSGKVHVYKTLIETIPLAERTQVQLDRNITTRKKVYKQSQYACPPCSEAVRRDNKTTPRKRESVEAAAQTDDSSEEEEGSSSGEDEMSDDSASSSSSDPADDMATEIAVENFIQARRQRQRARREQKDQIEEAEESNFFEIDNQVGQKRKR